MRQVTTLGVALGFAVAFAGSAPAQIPKSPGRMTWNTFPTGGRDDQQGAVAGAYIVEHLKGEKIAIVHDKTTYGQGLADETKKFINAKGTKEVLYEGINIGDKDFSALV